MREFLSICDTGDPLKDFYDEDDLASALCQLIQEKLGDTDEPTESGEGWTVVYCDDGQEEWGLVRNEFWDAHAHLEDTFYEDEPDLGNDFYPACENTYQYVGDDLKAALESLRARGFRVLENPTWFYDK